MPLRRLASAVAGEARKSSSSRTASGRVEVAAMPAWRQWGVRLLPRRHRWRLSYLAADIRRFERDCLERWECHTPGVASDSTSGEEDE